MQQMMDFQVAKQRHEELLREAEMNRQVNRAGSIEAAPKVVEGTAGSINLRVSG
jgi:ribosomal protein L11